MTSGRLSFFLPCVPPKTAHHAKKLGRVGGHARMFDSAKLTAAKQGLIELLTPHVPAAPLPAPVVVTVDWTWPWPTSAPKRLRARGRAPHTKRPDLSNVIKTLEDRLVQLRFIEDDGAVFDMRLRKWYGERAGIAIDITSLALVPLDTLRETYERREQPEPAEPAFEPDWDFVTA
jgi:Holliday junction resolvase RusA-like endonuclease